MRNISRRITMLGLVAGLGLLGIAGGAAAQTLERVKNAGVVRIGVMGEQAPWGSIDASGQAPASMEPPPYRLARYRGDDQK